MQKQSRKTPYSFGCKKIVFFLYISLPLLRRHLCYNLHVAACAARRVIPDRRHRRWRSQCSFMRTCWLLIIVRVTRHFMPNPTSRPPNVEYSCVGDEQERVSIRLRGVKKRPLLEDYATPRPIFASARRNFIYYIRKVSPFAGYSMRYMHDERVALNPVALTSQ